MKKTLFLLVCCLFLLTGCVPKTQVVATDTIKPMVEDAIKTSMIKQVKPLVQEAVAEQVKPAVQEAVVSSLQQSWPSIQEAIKQAVQEAIKQEAAQRAEAQAKARKSNHGVESVISGELGRDGSYTTILSE